MVQFASGLSRHPDPAVATAEMVGQIGDVLGGPPSVAVLFVAGSYVEVLDDVLATLQVLMSPTVLIGCCAGGVIGGAEEVEAGPAMSLWAATGLAASALRLKALPGAPPLISGLPDEIEAGSTVVVLADPLTFPVEPLIDVVNGDYPEVAIVGGLASAQGYSRVILDDEIHQSGAVGLVFGPGVATTVVSQGCRPIGSPWVVTEANRQLVQELGGRPAFDRLNELLEHLSVGDRSAAARGLHAGLVANEHKVDFGQGDFLIRGVLGADRQSGAVAIGAEVSIGRILQFQVRDADSASEEFRRLLAATEGHSALLFTCSGRGSHLFGAPNHDAELLYEHLGPAVSGMFCDGELGPIAGRNAIHAFTATALIFA